MLPFSPRGSTGCARRLGGPGEQTEALVTVGEGGREEPHRVAARPSRTGSMCVWWSGWNDDVMATPRVKSTSPAAFPRAEYRLRVRAGELAEPRRQV